MNISKDTKSVIFDCVTSQIEGNRGTPFEIAYWLEKLEKNKVLKILDSNVLAEKLSDLEENYIDYENSKEILLDCAKYMSLFKSHVLYAKAMGSRRFSQP